MAFMLNFCSTSSRPAGPYVRRVSGSVARRTMRLRHRLGVGGGHDLAAAAGRHQLGVAAHLGRDHRQAGGHGFQNGVGDAFGQRRQHETVQAAHDSGTSCRSPGSQARSASAGLIERCLATARAAGRRRPSPGAGAPSAGAISSARTKARASSGLVLDGLHAADGADQPMGRAGERAAGNRLPARRPAVKAVGIDAVVDLRTLRPGACPPARCR